MSGRTTWGRYTAPSGTIPYRPSMLIIHKAPMPPLHPHKTQRHTVLAAKQVGLYVPLNPPPLAQRGS